MKKSHIYFFTVFAICGLLFFFAIVQPLIERRNIPYCFKENKSLSERELIDRLLFGEGASSLNEGDKVDIMSRSNSQYPECCRAQGGKLEWKEADSNLLGYRGHYIFEFYSLNQWPSDKGKPYFVHEVWADACGNQIEDTGDDVTKEEYENFINQSQLYWGK